LTAFYALAVVGGPLLGPIIGSALTVTVNWRWTEYVQAIVTFAIVAMAFFTLPEMYAPVLLKHKAQKMRKDTGDTRYHHPHEELKLDFKSILTKHLSRPLRMLFCDPVHVTGVAAHRF
jgi:MFS family permease